MFQEENDLSYNVFKDITKILKSAKISVKYKDSKKLIKLIKMY